MCRLIPLKRFKALFYIGLAICVSSPFIGAQSIEPISEPEQRVGDYEHSRIWQDPSDPDKALNASASIEINATIQEIWAILIDCSLAPELVVTMIDCAVIERSDDPHNLWDIREQSFKAPFPVTRIKTRFRAEFTPYSHIEIRAEGGALKIQDVVWKLKALGHNRMYLSYEARIKPAFPVPRFFLWQQLRRDTVDMMRQVKRYAEENASNQDETDPLLKK